MTIWIQLHPLAWRVWPLYERNGGEYPYEERTVFLGPISIHGTPSRRRYDYRLVNGDRALRQKEETA